MDLGRLSLTFNCHTRDFCLRYSAPLFSVQCRANIILESSLLITARWVRSKGFFVKSNLSAVSKVGSWVPSSPRFWWPLVNWTKLHHMLIREHIGYLIQKMLAKYMGGYWPCIVAARFREGMLFLWPSSPWVSLHSLELGLKEQGTMFLKSMVGMLASKMIKRQSRYRPLYKAET